MVSHSAAKCLHVSIQHATLWGQKTARTEGKKNTVWVPELIGGGGPDRRKTPTKCIKVLFYKSHFNAKS